MESSPRKQEKVFAKGKLFELVHMEQLDGRIFEMARRAPGVRIIIHDEVAGKVLLTREYRQELQGWDYRLPGGKVFDSLDEYEEFRSSGRDVLEAAIHKALAESKEEAGIDISAPSLYKISVLGATVEWDLYVFEAGKWSIDSQGQELGAGEKIETGNWFSYDEIYSMVMGGAMQEERIALILLQWLDEKVNEND